MLLQQKDAKQSSAELAFEASEKSKVRSLLDLLNASSQDSPCEELLRRQLAPAESTQASSQDSKPAVPDPPVLTLNQIQAEIVSDDTVLLNTCWAMKTVMYG